MVSVCMATYNGERFLREQLDSILIQLAPDDELIVSDDGSTDSTLNILDEYKQRDERIVVLQHAKDPVIAKKKYSRNFYYATQNFENALNHAKGDYIFLSDQDDVWLPGKVEKMCEALKSCGLVLHNLDFIYENGDRRLCYNKNPLPKNWVGNLIAKPMPFWGCSMGFRNSMLKYILPFPHQLVAHDYWISSMALKHGKVTFIEEPLIAHRMYQDSVSYGTQNPLWYKVWYRLKMFIQLADR